MMLAIVIGSTLKGVVTGLLAGALARWKQSAALGVVGGLFIGFVLSSLAAIGQRNHYLDIVLPGMVVGALVGYVTQRYPPNTAGSRSAGATAICLVAAGLSAGFVSATWQAPTAAESLGPLAALVGRWTGNTEGQPGKGTVEREYERVLGSRFIQIRNRSTYPPQEKNPKGEVHEDIGFFGFDSGRKRLVLRQFHSEGFVNQYVLDPTSTSDRLVFTTEAIENIPAGWRARETYILIGPDQLDEIFELAEPGKEFELYSRNRLTRAR
jgi:hypothetical protein